MGWDTDFLQQAVEICTNDSGRIDDCPLFDIVSESVARSCEMSIPQALAQEDVLGPFAKLPGGVEVTYGDGSSDNGNEGMPSDKPAAPSLTYQPGEIPTNSAEPLPGQIFKESTVYEAPIPVTTSEALPEVPPPTSSTLAALQAPISTDGGAAIVESSAVIPTTTPAPVIEPLSGSSSYYSTQYITNGNLVSKILWEEEVVYVTQIQDVTTTVTVTKGASAAATPRRRRRGAAHLHRHAHGHF